MNSKRIFIALAVTALGISVSAVADEIYKWVDKDGNIHYQDRPAPDAQFERLQLTYNRTSTDAVQERVQSRLDSQQEKREARETTMADAAATVEEQAKQDKLRKQCEKYRAQLDAMARARPVYRQGENGERLYLDDAQREAARDKARQLINEHCSA